MTVLAQGASPAIAAEKGRPSGSFPWNEGMRRPQFGGEVAGGAKI